MIPCTFFLPLTCLVDIPWPCSTWLLLTAQCFNCNCSLETPLEWEIARAFQVASSHQPARAADDEVKHLLDVSLQQGGSCEPWQKPHIGLPKFLVWAGARKGIVSRLPTQFGGKANISACTISGKAGCGQCWFVKSRSSGFKINQRSTPIRKQWLETIASRAWPDYSQRQWVW